MPKLRPGQPAPDVTLKTLDGRFLPLSSLWGNGRPALLIFLRHLA
jgi:peroxiredoxin